MKKLLQNIIFPKEGICDVKEMYYRHSGNLTLDNEVIQMEQGCRISFDTYFNAFSVGKWKKYTVIDNVSLRFEYIGDIKLMLYHLLLDLKGGVVKTLIGEKRIHSGSAKQVIETVSYGEIKDDGIYTFEIVANEDSVIYNMSYCTEVSNNYVIKKINFALGFCTYKREEYILNNLQNIRNGIIDNNKSILNGHLHVFIADNGQTLPNVNSDNIHMFKNKNYGGVGGFTRTIIESVFNSKVHFDYIILCDDDIVLDCRIIERTYIFVQFLKKKYGENMIGGALLSLEEKFIQVESGAFFINGKIIRNHDFNMCSITDIVKNDGLRNPADYNGWFYCCIPQKIVKPHNLPLPIFVHCDDIEYGVRNQKEVITVNGLCIWHPSVIGKDPLWMSYYNTRNHIIVMSSLGKGIGLLSELFDIIKKYIISLTRYRYKEFEIQMMAIKDFYRGADVFMSIDPQLQHSELSSKYKYDWQEYSGNIEHTNKIGKKKQYILGVMNYFLPSIKKDRSVDNGMPYYDTFLIKKIYNVDKYNHRAYVLSKNYKAAWICLVQAVATMIYVIKNYNKARLSWEKKLPCFKSLEFWNEYLQINNKK